MILHLDDLSDLRLGPYGLIADPHALRRAGLFAAEGRLVAPRLLASRYRVHSMLVSDAAEAALRPLTLARPDIDVFVTSADSISTLAGFDFHRGCLALGYRDEPGTLDELLNPPEPGARSLGPLVILEGVNNPDNVGGIFRSAHAFGAAGIVLGPRCGDPLYRKAIRTSMGTSMQMPWAHAPDWPASLRTIRGRGYRLIALTTEAGAPELREVAAESRAPIAFLLGSEGFGLSPEALEAAGGRARIAMPAADADSLNVTAAASIALYEALRS
jgi:tRNA G18 (ribose-2'-O)-methylase SpoU